MAIYQKGDLKLDEAVVGTKTAADWASQGFTPVQQATATTPVAPVAPTAPQIPQGATAINGAEFNTREKQQANFTNIQPIGNTLYGIPKAPIVPDVIPQKDFSATMSPETLSKTAESAKAMVGFSEQQVADLNKAYQRQVAGTASETDNKNIDYARDNGWQPTETQEQKLQPKTSVPEPTPTKTTSDLILELYSNIGNIRAEARAEAMKDTKLMEKGEAIATASTLVNRFRTELQNNEILDIKEQDVIRAKPILTAQIQGQLEGLSREQKLDAMIMQNNYNNSLVELQIAQGNYDRAREIVKETADDAFETASLQLDALMFKNQIEDKEYERMKEDLDYERNLSLEGYTHIKSPEGLKGLSEDQIFRDPVSGKIYMKPAPEVSQIINVNGRQVGIDKNGNKIADFGVLTGDVSISERLAALEKGYNIDETGNLVRLDAGIVATATGDTYDIGSYATDPTHEAKVQSILNKIGQFNSVEDIDNYIKTNYPNSPVTGEMIANSASKYGVSWEMMTAIMAQDSSMGTAGKAVRTKNPGNVGNTDDGSTRKYATWEEGVDAVAENLEWRKTTATSTTTLSKRAKLVQENPALLSNYTNTEKGKILDELANAGADTTSLELAALGNTAIKDISQSKDALDSLLDLRAKINDNIQYVGPIKGLAALNPWSKARRIQADIDRIRQTVGKALEGGVLRKEDEEKYKKILSTITDTPETAQYKITQLISDIQSNIVNYGKGLGLSEAYINSKLLDTSLYEQNLLNENNIVNTSGKTSSGISYTIE